MLPTDKELHRVSRSKKELHGVFFMTRGCCDEQSIVLFCCFVVKKNNNVSDAESMRQLDSAEKCPFWDIILVAKGPDSYRGQPLEKMTDYDIVFWPI